MRMIFQTGISLPNKSSTKIRALVMRFAHVSTSAASRPDYGERFAVIRLTIRGEANPTKAKPALEGRALSA
jgi:hypothetical protein